MRIQEAYIENFGTLHHEHMTFDDGMTVLVRPNGTGKTTLTAFLCAMLYGLPAPKRGGGDDRTRYAPWQGGAYGGWIRLTAGGRRMQITRRFGERPRQDVLQWINLDTGRAIPEPESGIGMTLLGVDGAVFLRCVRITPEPDVPSAAWGGQLRALLSGSGDPDAYARAVARLEAVRRQIQPFRGKGGRTEALTQQLNTLTAQWQAAQSESAPLAAQQAACDAAQRAAAQAQEQLHDAQTAHAQAELTQTQYAQARAAFGEKVPDWSEIDAAEQAWRAAQTHRPVPDAEALRTAEADAAEWQACTDALQAEAISPELRTHGRALEQFFASGVPSEKLVAQWQSQADRLRKSETVPPFWVAAVMFGVSAAAEIGCFWVPEIFRPALRIGSALPAVVAAVLAAVWTVIWLRRRKTAAGLRAELRPVTDRYTPDCPVADGIAEIVRRRAEWTAIRAQLEEIRTRRSVQIANQRAAKARLDAFFARYGRPDAPDDGAALAQLRATASDAGEPAWIVLFRRIGWTANPDAPGEALAQIRAARQRLADAESAAASFPAEPSGELDAASEAFQSAQAHAAQQARLLENMQDARVQAHMLAAQRAQVQQQLQDAVAQRDRVDQTIALLRAAQDQLTGAYFDGLRDRFLHYFRRFTNEPDIAFDDAMQPQLMRDGLSRPITQFSSGTQSAAQFCMRLALIDLLFRERPFLILDDPFVYLDDARTAHAAALVREAAADTQILYLTCHSSRAVG